MTSESISIWEHDPFEHFSYPVEMPRIAWAAIAVAMGAEFLIFPGIRKLYKVTKLCGLNTQVF